MSITINGTGSITGLTAGGLPDGSITADDIASGAVTAAKLAAGAGGKILQVVSATKTDAQSFSTSYSDATDLSLSITMTSSSNKVLVTICLNHMSTADGQGAYFQLLRGSTVVTSSTAGGGTDTDDACLAGGGGGYSAGDRQRDDATLTVLDTPGAGTHTYKVRGKATGGTAYLNRWPLNTDQATVSSITLMEVAV